MSGRNRTRLTDCSDIPSIFLGNRGVESIGADHAFYHGQGSVPRNAVFIAGAGHFGKRAIEVFPELSARPLFLIDTVESRLKEFEGRNLIRIKDDAANFLSENFHSLDPLCTIIPAVPLHLAFEWVIKRLADKYAIRRIPVPEGAVDSPVQKWLGKGKSLLVSYADFLCPEDCPEPVDRCMVTGEEREKPLFELLDALEIPDYSIHLVRSRQLAPGIGAYNAGELKELQDGILSASDRKWIVGTACRCHGVLSAMALKPRKNQQVRKLFGTPFHL